MIKLDMIQIVKFLLVICEVLICDNVIENYYNYAQKTKNLKKPKIRTFEVFRFFKNLKTWFFKSDFNSPDLDEVTLQIILFLKSFPV